MTNVSITKDEYQVTVTEGVTQTVTVKAPGPQGPALPDGDKVDITVSNNGTSISINPGVVTYSKIQNLTTANRVLGGSAAGTVGEVQITDAMVASAADISGSKLLDDSVPLTKLGSGALPSDITIATENIPDFTIVNADVSASAAIAGTKINPIFGSQSIVSSLDGNQVTQGNAALSLTHATNSNLRANHLIVDDFPSGSGTYFIQATESGVTNDRNMCLQGYGGKLKIGSNSVAPTELLDVAGNIAVSGTVDGRDLATDGTKLDGIESGATADQTASEILTLLKTVDGAGSGLNADTLDGISSASFLRSDVNATFSGSTLTVNATLLLQDSIKIGDDAFIEDYNAANSVRIKGSQDTSKGFIAFGQQTKQLGCDGTSVLSYDGNEVITSAYTGALANGITATTQSAGDNSTKVATTAYTDTAISNLVDSSPSTLNTLNELAAALGDDANFSTTVTNSIATKMPLSGGEFTGNITFSGTQTVDGRDLSVDGAKLDGIASNAIANVVEDTSPQLGGDLQSNGNDIDFADNDKATFGTGADLQIFHDGTNTSIRNQTGQLYIRSTEVRITNDGVTEHMAKFFENGATELNFDNSKKLETLTDGIKITGKINIGSDSRIEADGVFKAAHGSESTPSYNFLNDNDNGMFRVTTNTIGFSTGGTERLRIDSSGRVGIGTTPTVTLDIESASPIIKLTDSDATGTPECEISGAGGDLILSADKDGEKDGSKIFFKIDGNTDVTIDHDGNVDIGGKINLSDNLDMPDNAKIVLGANDDLEIYHDGTHSHIREVGTGDLRLRSDKLQLMNENSEEFFVGTSNGSVELFYDDSKKVETTSTGATVTGSIVVEQSSSNINADFHATGSGRGSQIKCHNDHGTSFLGVSGDTNGDLLVYNASNADIIFGTNNTQVAVIDSSGNLNIPNDTGKIRLGTGNDLQIYHDGSGSSIDNATGQLSIACDDAINLQSKTGAEYYFRGFLNNRSELYFDGSKKLETTSTGVLISGNIDAGTGNFLTDDNGKFFAGTAGDLQIYHDGTDSYLDNTGGELTPRSNRIRLRGKTGNETLAFFEENAAAELYFDNSKKLETTSSGINVTNDITNTSGSDLVINSTGRVQLQVANGEKAVYCDNNGAVELYHAGSKKLETTSTGVDVTGDLLPKTTDTHDLGSNTKKWSEAHLKHYLYMPDDGRIRLGAGFDMQLFHDGNDQVLLGKTGNTVVTCPSGKSIRLNRSSADNFNAENMLRAFANGAVELYYDNSKKFETTSTGVTVTGNITASGGKLTLEDGNEEQIHRFWTNSSDSDIFGLLSGSTFGTIVEGANNGHHVIGLRDNDGSDSFAIVSGGGDFQTDNTYDTLVCRFFSNGLIRIPDNGVLGIGTASDLQLYHDGSNSFINNFVGNLELRAKADEAGLQMVPNGTTKIYYDGSKKLETTSTGVAVTGGVSVTSSIAIPDAVSLFLGNSNDLSIKHDGTDSFIKNTTGHLKIGDANVRIMNAACDEDMIHAKQNEEVELYFDNSPKLETTSTGVSVNGNLQVTDASLIASVNGNQSTQGGAGLVITHGTTTNLRANHFIVDDFPSGKGTYFIQATESGVSNDRNLCLQGYGGKVKIGANGTAPTELLHVAGNILASGTITPNSDITLKKDVKPLQDCLNKVTQLLGINFTYKSSNEKSMGLVAQDVEKVFPELIRGEEGNKSLNYMGLTGALIEAIKELSARVEALEAA